MSSNTDKLYQLLPAIYRVRDAEQGGQLRALLKIIDEQTDVLDGDIARLYDNLFIETCDEWVVPYLGDLLGVRGLHPVSDATFSQRSRVANTLRYRRRKGTAAMLEQLARDTTGWNARVVEFFQRLGTTQFLNHRRPQNLRTPNLRDANSLELIGTPFESGVRTVDVRQIASGRGQFNLPNIGVFLWRLHALPVDGAPAFDHGEGHYSFSQLGNDTQLFNRPVTEQDITHLAEEINVPAPIRRRGFLAGMKDYYGEDSSIFIWVNGVAQDAAKIVPCDLCEWKRRPDAGQIAVDPKRGRLAFPDGETPASVEVRYAYGFSSELGGGFYKREYAKVPVEIFVYPIAKSLQYDTINKAIKAWNDDGRHSAIFVIQDSSFYEEKIELSLPPGVTLEIRADRNHDGQQQRPVMLLNGPLSVTGEKSYDSRAPGGALIFDGLWLANDHVQVQKGDLASLQFRHCTLVPGWNLKPDGTPTDISEASLKVVGTNGHLQISFVWSIAGKLDVASAESLTVQDSVITAGDGVAIAGSALTVERSTVLGRVEVKVLELANNSIITGLVTAVQTQKGCVRFCYLPRDSKVSRRFRCQPDLAIKQTEDTAREQGLSLKEDDRNALATRLQPIFYSVEYGNPGFCQLDSSGPREIYSGADDESEMGVFHHLREPQREANLRSSLDEYLRAGMEAGVFYVV